MQALQDLKTKWLALPANQRTIALIVLMAMPAYFLAEAIFPSAPENAPNAAPVRAKPTFMSTMGSERLESTQTSGQLIAMRKKIQEREKAIDAQYTEQKASEKRIQQQVDTLQMSQLEAQKRLETIAHQMQMLVDQQGKLSASRENTGLKGAQLDNNTQQPSAVSSTDFSLDPMASLKSSVTMTPPVSKPLTMNRGDVSLGKISVAPGNNANTGNASTAKPLVAAKAKQAITQEDTASNKKTEKEPETWLSAGTVLPTVLLTGQHVPTSASAQANPAPVLLKIVDVGVMPNGFTIDLVGCTVIGAARGSASTRRVEIRAESISCIDQKGRAIEQPFIAAAQGQDGHSGIPAKLVTLYGEVVKQSFWAGIYGTGAQTLTQAATNRVSGDVVYDGTYFKNTATSSLAGGSSTAFDKIADFYLQLADEARPYLEMHGGIEGVDLIVQRGMSLKYKG
ncbi:TraB/VirB10 family protein [Shewanella baltica]|uniref:TraB/VirB10 family protein n=1 Tax=Shewanella baltica TaxID=62322 RepID=UPI0039B0E8A2